MNNSALVVKYAEIHLKGLNRPFFERKLVEKIEEALSDARPHVVREQGRIFVYDLPEEHLEEYAQRLQKVFGIHSVAVAACGEKSWEEVRALGIRLMAAYKDEPKTFKVFARRADKRFPMTSEMICRDLGHELLEAYPNLKVDVHHPQIPLTVEIRQDKAFLYTGEIPCAGGMPVGTNGKAMLLIPGGIDSPVAGYMIAKRGVALSAIHFYSYPYTSERARDKVVELAEIVSEYAGAFDLYLVPFTEIQTTIYDKCPARPSRAWPSPTTPWICPCSAPSSASTRRRSSNGPKRSAPSRPPSCPMRTAARSSCPSIRSPGPRSKSLGRAKPWWTLNP